jgi:acyl-CoA synthetase (NDP forming)
MKRDAMVYRLAGHHLKGVFYETPEGAVKAAARMVEYQRLSQHGTPVKKDTRGFITR